MDIPKIKTEIEEYLIQEGWTNDSLYHHPYDDHIGIDMTYFTYSFKGRDRKLHINYSDDDKKLAIYLLEFIGHILRKYNVRDIQVENTVYRF